MPRLLIVSNRLPVTVRAERGEVSVVPSAGGLATAMRGPHQRHEGLWIGWPGDVSRLSAEQRREVDRQLAELRTVPVALSAGEVSRYYDGLSNGVLWPLFHYLLDKVRFDARRDFEAYEAVNERFAIAVAERYKPGDMIWVHDYQLMLVPELLRRRLPDARIGFFLHIPFPADEVFRTLPYRTQILRGLLGADVLGFHTEAYRRHFVASVESLLGMRSDGDAIVHEGRRVQTGAYPISIDVDEFADLAARPEVEAEVRRIRAAAPGARIVLGIDRLDYTKGVLRRLLAIERFLERASELRRKVRFIQLAVPTRENVDAYADLRRSVNEAVGRINGQHGTVDVVPIHLLYRAMPAEQVVALYRAADVMMVTPLRDGMNLVAKEYVTTRLDDTGVLVLSEFTGALDELSEALSVNPYDVDAMAAALKRALLMPQEEQQTRMRALRKRVREHDVHRWAEAFLTDLERAAPAPAAPPLSAPTPPPVAAPPPAAAQTSASAPSSSHRGAPPAEVVARVCEAPRLLLLLDYDGTLAPIAPVPELAAPDEAMLALLRDLAARPGTKVDVISGRRREDLVRWLGELPIGLHGEHGFCSRAAPGEPWTVMEILPAVWKAAVRPILDEICARTPGSFVEDKPVTVAWHYRNIDPELARPRVHELVPRLADLLREHRLEAIQGSMVVEVRPLGLHKGLVVPRVLAAAPEGTQLVAIGDDRTDEDLFAALSPEAVSIHVGSGPTRAAYSLPDVGEVRRFLRSLLS